MALFRRFLALSLLAFWQGGFAFYGAVVVPVGQGLLGSHFAQGLITQAVTRRLEVAGALALLALGWESLRSPRRLRLVVAMAVTLAIQVPTHLRMDALVLAAERRTLPPFDLLHHVYLTSGTVGFVLAGAWVWFALREWSAVTDTEPAAANPARG